MCIVLAAILSTHRILRVKGRSIFLLFSDLRLLSYGLLFGYFRRHGTAFPSNCRLLTVSIDRLHKDSKVISSLLRTLSNWRYINVHTLVSACHKRRNILSCRLSWWLHWLSVRLVVERSLVRLSAGALSSQLGHSAFHPSGVGKSSTGLHGWV